MAGNQISPTWKQTMTEKCLLALSLAALVCHPSSSIKCFKPKPRTTSPPKEERPSSPRASRPQPQIKRIPSKSRKKHSSLSNDTTLSATAAPSVSTKSDPLAAVSELTEREPSFGIVEVIIRSGWATNKASLTIEKLLKVYHNVNVLNQFEEYREMVKSNSAGLYANKKTERLAADGNELLLFHGAIITCSLGVDGVLRTCDKKCCGVCRLITSSSGFPVKKGSLSFFGNSWEAHRKVVANSIANGVCARKAIVICRVIAGQVAHLDKPPMMEREGGCFDSVVVATCQRTYDSEGLVILNPRAVLPCFVVIYH